MSISDPIIEVTCDRCSSVDTYGLTPLARHSYDERNLKGQMEHDGWRVDGDTTICESCVAAEEATDD